MTPKVTFNPDGSAYVQLQDTVTAIGPDGNIMGTAPHTDGYLAAANRMISMLNEALANETDQTNKQQINNLIGKLQSFFPVDDLAPLPTTEQNRSEERRVGKECRL